MKEQRRRLLQRSGLILLWAYTIVRDGLDWFGRAAMFEDPSHQLNIAEKGANWLFSTPPWVPTLLAVAATLAIFWPNIRDYMCRQEEAAGAAQSAAGISAASSAEQVLSVDYKPNSPDLGHMYCETRTHPQTQKTTRIYRISVANQSGKSTSGRLVVLSIQDKFGDVLQFERQSLRSTEATNGNFSLTNAQTIFFDVVAYYKGDPEQVFVCGSTGGAHFPVSSAPFSISLDVTGDGAPQRKVYRFDFDKSGDLIFEEI